MNDLEELKDEPRCAHGTWTNQKWPCSCRTSKCRVTICYKKERLKKHPRDGASFHSLVPPEFFFNRDEQTYMWVRSGYCCENHCRHYVSRDVLDVGVPETLALEDPDEYNTRLRDVIKQDSTAAYPPTD